MNIFLNHSNRSGSASVDKPSERRALSPETFWAGSITIECAPNEYEKVPEAIKAAADKTGITYSGFLVEAENGLRYEITRYPRRAFGPVPSIEEYEARLSGLKDLLSEAGFKVTRGEMAFPEEESFRVVLGLEEGYLENKKRDLVNKLESGEISDLQKGNKQTLELLSAAGLGEQVTKISGDDLVTSDELVRVLNATSLAKTHTTDEITRITQDICPFEPVRILTAGPWGIYQEPAVLIGGPVEHLPMVENLADSFRQARIAVELIGPNGGKSYMLEFTNWCPDPDKN